MSIFRVRIELRRGAVKDLDRIDSGIRARVLEKLAELANFPNVANVKKLTRFEPAYRLRVGDYRVLFDVEGDVVAVGRVLHRKDSYR